MLRATIDLIPHGQEDQRRTLQTLEIVNVGGTRESGRYHCELMNAAGQVIAEGAVTGWPRREREPAALVHEALRRLGYGQ